MSLRVLDDERPGFALLLFSGRLQQPSLTLSIRSLRENAFLGPDGKWRRSAHFFVAERVGDNARGTEYRVGPEIVNHLLEHDQILVADAEGTLREEALWENAVPQMPGTATSHSIYRPPAQLVSTETKPSARLVSPQEAEPRPSPPPPAPPAPVAPPPEPTPPPPPPKVVAKAEPPPEPKPKFVPPSPAPAPVPPPKPAPLRYLPFAAISVVLLALLAIPQLRCSLFGMSCPAPVPTPAEDALTRALACAAEREVSTPCEVRSCFSTYLAAARDVAANATAVMDSADQACRAQRAAAEAAQKSAAERARLAEESQALQRARQCAATTSDCNIKTCYDGYFARYGTSGTYRSDARADIAAADARCEVSRNAARAMPDGIYNAASLRGCGIAAETGIRVTVSGSTVSWQHEFKGTKYSWTGSVDKDGNIRASAGPSLVASGRYSDAERDVQMQYPQCGSETITLTIIGRL